MWELVVLFVCSLRRLFFFARPDIWQALDGSDAVELHENKEKVRRTKPLPEHSDEYQRSIYSKPYPLDVTWEEV